MLIKWKFLLGEKIANSNKGNIRIIQIIFNKSYNKYRKMFLENEIFQKKNLLKFNLPVKKDI